jgi:N-acetylglutamate synthase-like GNAT family acetyltransferase
MTKLLNRSPIQAISLEDSEQVRTLLCQRWGDSEIISRGKVLDTSILPGFIAKDSEGKVLGIVTLNFENDSCEIVTLDTFEKRQGFGRALFEATLESARAQRISRLWLITTNDNVNAIGFYQKVGMRMIAIHLDAVTDARKLKPEIPLVAYNGIPIRDEIEFEIEL